MIYRVALAVGIILFFVGYFAHAKDYGQWEDTPKEVREWYAHLMQPDNPAVSCCGESDAYWCDEIHVRDVTNAYGIVKKQTYCTITDDRDDTPLLRRHIP